MYVIRTFGQFYINVNDGADEFIETYSLRMATQFKTKKAAEKWYREFTDWERHCEAIKLTDEMLAEYDAWAETMTRRKMKKLDKSGKHNYDPAKHTIDDVVQFWINHSDFDGIPFEAFKTWPKLHTMKERPHIWGVTKHYGQADLVFGFELVFPAKQSDFEQFEKDIEWALSFGLTRKTDDGGIIFEVFDHYLCEFGNKVSFVWRSTDDCSVIGRSGSDILRGDLKKCYDYLIEHRWYDFDE